MKYLKKYEQTKIGYYVVIELFSSLPEILHIFPDEISANNYVTNLIHEHEEEDYGDDYPCKNIFDIKKLLEYWNKRYGDIKGNYIYIEFVELLGEIKLEPKLEIRKDSLKYNL